MICTARRLTRALLYFVYICFDNDIFGLCYVFTCYNNHFIKIKMLQTRKNTGVILAPLYGGPQGTAANKYMLLQTKKYRCK